MKNQVRVVSLEQLHAQIISKSIPAYSKPRSWEGNSDFLRNHYVKRKGRGIFVSDAAYRSSIIKVLGLQGRFDWQLHTMSRDAVEHLIGQFNLKQASRLSSKDVRDYNSALEAYLAYIDFCEGRYISKRLRAAA